MARCDVCGNDYDKSFTVTPVRGESKTFDSFECAIHALAPPAPTAAARSSDTDGEGGAFQLCANCATQAGAKGMKDRA
jgi:hypothetical protein